MPSMISRLAGRRSRPDSLTLLPIGLGLVGFFLILALEATYGVVLNWDSANYIHVAHGLLSGDGFVQVHTADHYINWTSAVPCIAGCFVCENKESLITMCQGVRLQYEVPRFRGNDGYRQSFCIV